MKENYLNSKGLQWSLLFVFSGILFFSTLQLMIERLNNEDYTYCYLIPVVVIYLFWDTRQKWMPVESRPGWTGFIVLIAGLLMFIVGELAGEPFSTRISFCVVVLSLFWIQWGWGKLKIVLFPLLFLFTMVPLPHFFHNSLSLRLKLLSSKIGVWMMQVYGLSAYREGNVIDLGFTQLQVVDACNGLRYLIPLTIMSILLAYLFKSAVWKKLLIVFSSIPISVIVNSLRIASVGILYKYWGSAVAEGFFHDFSGWFIFMLSLGFLLLEIWVLNHIFPEIKKAPGHAAGHNEKRETGSSIQQDSIDADHNVHPVRKPSFFSPQFVAAAVMLGATLAFSQGIDFREKTPISQTLDNFPLKVGSWPGKKLVMEKRFIDALDLSDYTMIDYIDKNGTTINFYVAYYESQRSGKSIHSPASCLPGGGWEFRQSGTVVIDVKGHAEKMVVNRTLIQKGSLKQLSYYWFSMRGRVLTNAYQMKLYNFWDALTRQRTDGALVRVITPLYENEELSDTEERLRHFVREVVPVLDTFLPQ